jgi:hypothetical protein
MAMAMTLRLVEKAIFQCFKTLGLPSRTRSTILILFCDQRSRSTSGLYAFRVSTFLTFLLPKRLYSKFLIHRWVSSHRSGAVNHFEASGLRSFKLPSCTFSQSAFTRSRRSFDMCPLESTVDIYFGLQEFFTKRNLSHLSLLECSVFWTT